jgi:hypothetical protein
MNYARILILFGENVVRCWFVSSTINCFSCFCLNWFISYLFWIKEKRHCLSEWSEVLHYYFISEKTPKHNHAFIQTSSVFAAFWPLCRYKLNARSIHTAERLTPTLRVTLVFYFEHILRLKTTENVSNQMFKMCGRKLSDTYLADFIQKKSLKLFARVKMYVQVTNVHALVRGLQNRTRQTSMRSCAVRNELRSNEPCAVIAGPLLSNVNTQRYSCHNAHTSFLAAEEYVEPINWV